MIIKLLVIICYDRIKKLNFGYIMQTGLKRVEWSLMSGKVQWKI